MTPRLALSDGFKLWLDEVAGGAKVRRGHQMYPFATSLRSTARMVPFVKQVAVGPDLETGDSVQVVADLNFAGLATGQYPDHALTEVGMATLSRWRELEIDNTDEIDEVARCAVLVGQGLTAGTGRYVDAYELWCRLVQLQPADYWFTDIYTLCLPMFLDQENAQGYNPFKVLTVVNKGEIGAIDDWRDWAENDATVGALLTKLLDRTKESFRVGGCRAFCRGMEARRLATEDPDQLPIALAAWGISND